jgi:hypothetical protein
MNSKIITSIVLVLCHRLLLRDIQERYNRRGDQQNQSKIIE